MKQRVSRFTLKTVIPMLSMFVAFSVSSGAFAQTSDSTGYDWKNWSDTAIFEQGEDLRDRHKEGHALTGSENSARGAYARFQYLCENGHTQGCVYAVDTARTMLKSTSLEVASYTTACDAGEIRFCGAGLMTTKSNGPLPDAEKARAFARKGCAIGGDDYLCKMEAYFAELDNLPSYEDMPIAEVAKECEAGENNACAYAAYKYTGYKNAGFQSKDMSLAYRYMRLGCERDHLQSCEYAMYFAAPENGTSSDADLMALAMRKVCQLSSDNSCANGYVGYKDGRFGVEVDDAQTFWFASQSCDRFDEICYGAAYYAKSSGQLSEPEINAYAEKACNLGDGQGCAMAGNHYLRTDLDEMGVKLHKEACRLGWSSSCELVTDRAARLARRKRLDEEYERCRDGCGQSYRLMPAPTTQAWEPSYCTQHRREYARARQLNQPFTQSAACNWRN